MASFRSISLVGVLATTLVGCPDDNSAPTPVAPAASSVAAVATTPAPSASATSAPVAARPLYFERAVTPPDLDGRTLRELSLMRNTIYARAGNSFRRPWLNAHFSAQPWYRPAEKMDESKITDRDRRNAQLIAEHDSAIDKAELERRRDEVLARKKAGQARPEDAVELSLLSQRLGTWLGDENAPTTPLENPSQLDRLVTVEELATFSRRDLRILRNTVYARRGRSFDSKVVRAYFASATWYKPREDFHDGMLTGVDHKNIKIIRSVEDSLGGPEHENPNYGKDGWFIMA